MDGVEFYSHRDPLVKLCDHLKEVSDRVLNDYKIQKNEIKLPIDEKFLRDVSISHDFGKYTTFFQKYIVNGKKDRDNRHYHGFISALFGAWLSEDRDYLPLIAYFVIKHHHGDLKNFEDDLNDSNNFNNLLIAKEQIENISQNREKISSEYGFSINGFLEGYKGVYEKLKRLKFELLELEEKEKRVEVYFSILYTYSLLIDSDKKSASKTDNIERKTIPKDLVENYRKFKGWINSSEDINKLRNELYQGVKNKVINLKKIPNISTITAPTGLGKTFINLEVALQFKHKLKNRPRIIYSLPFTSIIDQTYKIFDEILFVSLQKEYIKNKNAYLLKHHHLSNTHYTYENEEKPLQESLLLIESWNSEIIVTTFVQFLNSVIAFKNSFIKKFHNIVGSIIVLDEIQSINVELWKAIEFVLKKLTEIFNCKIILSTATKPLIFNEYEELVENSIKYFTSPTLRRTKIIPKIEAKKTIEDFFNYFIQAFDCNINSYLIVFNTIKTSILFFEKIRENFSGKYEICYLSTNIVPAQRKVRIREIKGKLNNGEKIIVISTQVIEAGVDLDFEKVIRDIGPVDSIIQVAGRCNRNNKNKVGHVEVHILCNEEIGKDYSKMIYGSTAVDISMKLLTESYMENEYKNLTDKYYKFIKENKSFAKSKAILEDIESLNFYSDRKCIAKDFTLIEEAAYYRDLFIEVNETAKRIYQAFKREVIEEKNIQKKTENYLRLKNSFRKYIISVPIELIKNAIDLDIFPRIPLENLGDFYDKNGCGFKRIRNNTLIF